MHPSIGSRAPLFPKHAAASLFFSAAMTLVLLFAHTSYGTLLPVKPGDKGTDHGISWKAHVLKEDDTPKSLFQELAEDAVRFNRMAVHYWEPGTVIKRPVDEDMELLEGWTPMPEKYEDCPGRTWTRCIVVSLSTQFLGVYRYDKLQASYPVSTGIPEYETPTGTFRVLSSSPYKDVKFGKIFSYTYGVWMRWPLHIGHEIFIHAGNLPGYPASHGCIRLMRRPAYKVFRMAPIGTPVVIIG